MDAFAGGRGRDPLAGGSGHEGRGKPSRLIFGGIHGRMVREWYTE